MCEENDRDLRTIQAGSKPYFEGPLRKRDLMALPAGGILQSNATHDDDPSPAFEAVLGPVETREALWIQLRKERLTQIKFRYFVDGSSYDAEVAKRDEALIRQSVRKVPKQRTSKNSRPL
jgi:hypothetical protein